MAKEVDINENQLLEAHKGVFRQLLYDHSTRKNIFWATDSYAGLGIGYAPHDEITIEKITGGNGNVIIPRSVKAKVEQSKRTKDMAEVFTPSTVCKTMVDYIMPEPAGSALSLSHCSGLSGCFTYLEITCGEAPFLVSRYDTVTGEPIPIDKRIGILDRLLRNVNATAADEDYARQSLLALGSVYGYEWQGDNLFIAREAVLTSFVEYYVRRFGSEPDESLLLQAAEIVSWNLWQMDGLKAVVPDTCHEVKTSTADLFGNEQSSSEPCPGCAKDDIKLHNGIRCRLRRWLPSDDKKSPYGIDFFDFSFLDIINKKTKTHNKTKYTMNFDYIIGNPPYQEETTSDSTRMPPIYDKFIDGAVKVAKKVELIHPARFLFNAGFTSKTWNEKMLHNKHFKVLQYEPDSHKVFPTLSTPLKGGVAITYYDNDADFGEIGTFTKFPELNSILSKVQSKHPKSLESIISSPLSYKVSDLMIKENPNLVPRLRSSAFAKLSPIFYSECPSDGKEYIAMIGLDGKKRAKRYVRKDYIIDSSGTLDKYTLLIAKANGDGNFGETLSAGVIAEPGIGYLQTFIGIGKFDSLNETKNVEKYIKTKFLRAMLGILKTTQDCPGPKWKYVPLQDFTSSSDIDWSKGIHEIDLQLYAKYGLDSTETAFIEKMVKPME